MFEVLKDLIFSKFKLVSTLMIGFVSVLGLLFTRRQAKQEERKDIENEILHTNVTRVLEETEKIVENQDRQDEIDAHPSPTRDDIHKWMRGETKASPKRNKNK